jgi:lysophospholipase L1-like esterase
VTNPARRPSTSSTYWASSGRSVIASSLIPQPILERNCATGRRGRLRSPIVPITTPSLNALRRAAALFATAVFACVLFASTASAAKRPALTPSSPVTRGSAYLALGDSVTFGYQEESVVPAPDYMDAATFHGYPEQLGAELRLKVTNAACPGETSASMINPAAPSEGCETGYRKAFPLHVHYTGSQLRFALSFLRKHKNTRLVSLMIGANDAFQCEGTTPDHCTSPSELASLEAEISHNVHTILSSIRKKAHYGGQLVIVNYYSLDYASPVDNAESTLLNTTVDKAAKPFHVEIANGYGEFQFASMRFGNDPCFAGLLTELDNTAGDCGIHPSYAGQTLLAASVADAIKS